MTDDVVPELNLLTLLGVLLGRRGWEFSRSRLLSVCLWCPLTSLCHRSFSKFTSPGSWTCPACRDIIWASPGERCSLHVLSSVCSCLALTPTPSYPQLQGWALGTAFGYMASFRNMLTWVLGEYCQSKRTKTLTYRWDLEESQEYDL